ncbi:MAG TPA: 4-alpha-glucanotransferase [Jiangellales bacterium]|nr:4-alpha-glucanotransferase [Jiangellales bacterium]
MTRTASLTPELVELAAVHGVATEFWDWQGRHVAVPSTTVVAVLGALGVDASTTQATEAALADHRLARWRRMLPPTIVTRTGWTPWFWVHCAHGEQVEAWVECEDGSERRDVHQQDHWVDPRQVDGRLIGEATFALPGDLPPGWHRLRARAGDREATATLVVTPGFLGTPPALGDRRAWGLALQLYSVRSARSWGVGDLADLADVATWSGHDLGAGFVLVNPLHAAAPVTPMEPSPYLPTTRRFVNPVYVRVEAVPEYGYLDARDRAVAERVRTRLRAQLAAPGGDARVDRDRAWSAKRRALALVHRVQRSPGREIAYRAFLEREGTGLRDFATWCALVEVHGPDWHEWPAELRDPAGPAVEEFRRAHGAQVDFHCWLQWVLDDQLEAAQAAARDAGMPLGVVHDLAVGVHPDGADAWGLQDVLAQGIKVGAPPDAFNQQGQDWSQPPWRPDRLAETGYAAYRDLLRTVLRHAGGLRVDHVVGLFRLWWVPEGAPPTAGTYVRYDHEALIGILVLEAQRAGALVVGEDLGTVEPWARDYLRERGVLGTSVLWFERDEHGAPLAPERWRELCLATVTTHDLPPTAGYLAGDHVRLRDELGLLTRDVDEELAVDAAERASWLAALTERGLLREGAGVQETTEALHRLLTWTPSRLLGASLTDAVGDRRTQNQPGTSDEYPNWRIPLSDPDGRPLLLEEVVRSERARALARVVGG